MLHFLILLQGDIKTISSADLIDTGIHMYPNVGISGRLPNFFFHHAGAAGDAAIRRLAGQLGCMTAQRPRIFNQFNCYTQSRQINGGAKS